MINPVKSFLTHGLLQALELTPKVIKKAKNIFKNSLLVRFEHLYKSLILLVFHFLEQKTSIRN